MLRELHITGLGVIEDVDLALDAGLNVVTGETGAGKTMLTVGLALALGMRSSASLVRRGASAARIQARFDAPDGDDLADLVEDGELVLARSVGADGRSSARIGGQLAPVASLARLAPLLVEVHGQNRTQRLLAAAAQTALLDRFAGAEHLGRVADHTGAFAALREATGRLEELVAGEREREREVDLLAYQVREIETAAIRPGELQDLELEESRLANAERLLGRLGEAVDGLGADAAAGDALRAASAALADAAEADPSLAELASRANALAEEASELGRDARDALERIRLDPARLAEVRERIHAIRALERKYGEGEEGVLAYLREASERLEALTGSDEERAALEARVRELEARAAELAREVGDRRRAAATPLAEALLAELGELGMQGAGIEVRVVGLDEPIAAGAERAELWFAGGPGQAPLPLAKVASGGELSRTMLACRSVMADLDDVPTLVFDEVDAGIGGRAGIAVGRRLAALGRGKQVLVVTHLPQIASFADRHIRVEKTRGTATATVLDGEARVEELSRMLAGHPGSGSAAEHAEELLVEAGRVKASR